MSETIRFAALLQKLAHKFDAIDAERFTMGARAKLNEKLQKTKQLRSTHLSMAAHAQSTGSERRSFFLTIIQLFQTKEMGQGLWMVVRYSMLQYCFKPSFAPDFAFGHCMLLHAQ
jgi:hypothetical protein